MPARRQYDKVIIHVKTIWAKSNSRCWQLVNVVATREGSNEPASALAGTTSTTCDWSDDGPADNIDMLRPKSSTRTKKYNERQMAEMEEWAKIRGKLLGTRIDIETPGYLNCVLCRQTTDGPLRCNDCCPFMQCCTQCEVQLHKNSVHYTSHVYGRLVRNYFGVHAVLSGRVCW